MKKGLIITLFLTVIIALNYGYTQGCSQCKLVAEQGAELDEASFGTNINYGILYLMILPYLLIMFLFRHKIIAFLKRKFKKA